MGFDAGDLHIDTPLTNLVIGFEPKGFIVDQIFPEVPVGKQSDKFYKWEKGDFFRIADTLRAPKTKGRRVEFNVSSDSYFASNYALVHEESFEAMANADTVLSSREKRVRALKSLIMLDWENRVAAQISSGSNVGSFTTLSGTGQWSDHANSDPFNDVEIGKEAIRATTGMEPNLIIIPKQVMATGLKHHPDMVDRVKYTGTNNNPGLVTANALAQVFDVERVLVPTAIKNTGSEGLADSFTNVWPNNVILAYVTDGPDPDGQDPSLGYTFRWADSILGVPFAAEIWNDPDGGNFENRRVQTYQDEKLTATELGYVIADAV